MTTLRHVSQCCSLRYSFNFSHKCPELVGSSSLQSYAKSRITMLITALHSGQLPPSSATRRAQFSQNLACSQGTKAKPSMGANKHTSQRRDGVLQQLAFLVPTLWPFALVPVRHFPVLQIPVTRVVLVVFKPYLKDQLVSFSALTGWFGHMTCKNRPRYDLECVWWDVKPCSINLTDSAKNTRHDALTLKRKKN